VTTSGTSVFNLPFNEMAEEAYERCGVEMRSGYQLRTARRSMNLLTIEWANRGINLWTIEQGEIPLVTGQVAYPLPDDTIDLLDHVIRQNEGTTNQIDINITRISETMYSTIPNKLAQGRPIQVWINRQSAQSNQTNIQTTAAVASTATSIPVTNAANLASAGYVSINGEQIYYNNIENNTLNLCSRGQNGTVAANQPAGSFLVVTNNISINVWPTANSGGGYTFVYWRMRRIQDVVSGNTVQDIPFRFIPCMVAGLTYYLSLKIPEAMARSTELKLAYNEQWDLASTEDREKASLRLVPREQFYS
jgi:hypothetical protein